MKAYKTIVVMHPGAIGDTVMGTPVAAALKQQYPDSRLIYLTHESLFPLLALSRSIDGFLPFQKDASPFATAKLVKQQAPDLLVDLVGSLKTRCIGWLAGASTLTLNKRRDIAAGLHVVDSYLQTLAPLKLDVSQPAFPSLFPSQALIKELADSQLAFDERLLIALVPGVGQLRPNRAWTEAGWLELGKELLSRHPVRLALLGGPDDRQLCSRLHAELTEHCHDLSGRLTLPLTAALLSRAQLVISGDTGPAHIAAAVGAKVIALTGPTDPARTGPYGMREIGIYAGGACRCRSAKRCSITGTGAGHCMEQIKANDVVSLAERLLLSPDAVYCRPGNHERSLGG